jgi:ribosomal protein L31
VSDRGGLKTAGKTCQPCYADKSNSTMTIVRGDSTTQAVHTCKDCHMPYTGNTAVKQNNNRGDQVRHMWKMNTDPVNKVQGMFTTDSLAVRIPSDSVVSGVYLYQLESNKFIDSKQRVLTK